MLDKNMKRDIAIEKDVDLTINKYLDIRIIVHNYINK